jgi:hypothetical protein
VAIDPAVTHPVPAAHDSAFMELAKTMPVTASKLSKRILAFYDEKIVVEAET